MCARDLLMGVLLTTEEESVEFPKKDRHLANSQHYGMEPALYSGFERGMGNAA